ncbi:hypothetical protein FDP41_002598 [Naegleria fowleri]|uniref:Uncharacterized protein n=1 Tax=Naegleria fowleri TaxID=5763 RepID=A0A6A5BJI3_NAEFO|nr:uncharacterized protein FDP41_002598 [Naegleria fowleri]KAF0978083.1 hypothetical protein FDP41_002598 [Naegleria fowleri]CAG4715138.1 unnamed protein product [Naegleria fowleri]
MSSQLRQEIPMVQFLTNPFPFVRSHLSPLYIFLFKLFLPSNHSKLSSQLERCEIILQQTLAFVHYFHPSLLNRWLHASTIVPFFCGIFLVLGFLVKSAFGLEVTFPFVVVWSLLFVFFVMGIDRYASIILALYCTAICYTCHWLLRNNDALTTGIPTLNSGQVHVLLWGLSLLSLASIGQVVLGHLWIDQRTPAFLIQEALLITPIYMILSCVLMENPLIRYLPNLKNNIENHATSENFQRYARIK